MIRAGEILSQGKTGMWLDYLAIVRRMQIQAGHTPQRAEYNCNAAMIRLWRTATKQLLGAEVSMLEASPTDLETVLPKLASAVNPKDDRFPFYPDGWKRQVLKWRSKK